MISVFIEGFEKVVVIYLFVVGAWVKLILIESYVHHFRWYLLTAVFLNGMNGIFIFPVDL